MMSAIRIVWLSGLVLLIATSVGKAADDTSPDNLLIVLAWSPAASEASDTSALGGKNGVVEYPPDEQAPAIANVVPMFWLKADVTPEQAKLALDQQPEGYRCMIWVWDGLGGDPLKSDADKIKASDGSLVRGIWAEHGVAQTAAAMRDFFTHYKSLGGKLDYLVLDYEEGFTRWHRGMTPKAFAAIESDPRFSSEGWANKLGFNDLVVELTEKPFPTVNQKNWNAVMGAHRVELLNSSISDPVLAIFPNAKISNYGDADLAGLPDLNGHERLNISSLRRHTGTHQSANVYGIIQSGLSRKKFNGEQAFGSGPFQSLVLGVNTARAMAIHGETPFMPWVGFLAFVGRGSEYSGSDYYQEMLLHVAMTGPEVILYWNPYPWRANQDPTRWSDAEQDQLVGRLMRQFNTLAGFEDFDSPGWLLG